MTDFVGCSLKMFECEQDILDAASHAIRVNPMNRPTMVKQLGFSEIAMPTAMYTAILTTRRWHTDGVNLSVSFLDNPATELRTRILSHMNAWGDRAKVKFSETQGVGQVRIARAVDGHWSYLGTDVLLIDPALPTMNLQNFTMDLPDSEFRRVVRHEAGHTLGFVHEHLRDELIQRLVRQKVIDFYAATQGWSEEQTVRQVLTPIDPALLVGTATADQDSIMCYQIPGTLTDDGQPIRGGIDINPSDAAFAALCYPK